MTVDVPQGRLVRSRVVDDPGEVLAAALDRSLTGYAVFEPQDALLFDDGARCVLTFDDGVPVLAYDATADRGGPDVLADLASPGPSRVELYELPAEDLDAVDDAPPFRVPPDLPADRLAGDPDLAARTREAAPDDRLDDATGDGGAVESFLENEAKIEAIRERARDEAQRRADEWGLSEVLDDEAAPDPVGGDGAATGDAGEDPAPAGDADAAGPTPDTD
jgi:hypothetical protein